MIKLSYIRIPIGQNTLYSVLDLEPSSSQIMTPAKWEDLSNVNVNTYIILTLFLCRRSISLEISSNDFLDYCVAYEKQHRNSNEADMLEKLLSIKRNDWWRCGAWAGLNISAFQKNWIPKLKWLSKYRYIRIKRNYYNWMIFCIS